MLAVSSSVCTGTGDTAEGVYIFLGQSMTSPAGFNTGRGIAPWAHCFQECSIHVLKQGPQGASTLAAY